MSRVPRNPGFAASPGSLIPRFPEPWRGTRSHVMSLRWCCVSVVGLRLAKGLHPGEASSTSSNLVPSSRLLVIQLPLDSAVASSRNPFHLLLQSRAQSLPCRPPFYPSPVTRHHGGSARIVIVLGHPEDSIQHRRGCQRPAGHSGECERPTRDTSCLGLVD